MKHEIVPLGPNFDQYEIDRYKIDRYWIVVEITVIGELRVRIWDNGDVVNIGVHTDGRSLQGSYVFDIFVPGKGIILCMSLAICIKIIMEKKIPSNVYVRIPNEASEFNMMAKFYLGTEPTMHPLIIPVTMMHLHNATNKKPLLTIKQDDSGNWNVNSF